MLVSPAEQSPLLRALGQSSSQVEPYGADFLLLTPLGLSGIQRKEVRDLVASLRDGRLQRELVQAEALVSMVLIVEGDWQWDRKGVSRRVRGYTIEEYRGVIASIQIEHGWAVIETGGIRETAEVVEFLDRWFQKKEHGSLLRVPKGRTEPGIHILQHFPGVSLTRATAVRTHFGRVPLRWDVTKEELMGVPGLGKITVEKMIKVLEP